jgi:hypothetical protein
MRSWTNVIITTMLLLLPLVPQTPHEMAGEPVPQTDARQIAYIVAQQKVILEQLQMVLDIRKLVISNTQRITDNQSRLDDVETRIDEHIKTGSSDPTRIAIAEVKLDYVIKLISWVLGGLGSLILGAAGVLIKRRLDQGKPPDWATQQAQAVANRLEVHDEKLEQYHTKVFKDIQVVKDKADQAYTEANAVNQKISSIGMKMNNEEPLKSEEVIKE